MVHSAVRILFQILSGLALLVLLGLALAAWRLHQGPVPLSGLTPYIEDALNRQDTPFRVHLGEAFLAWDGGDHPLSLRVRDVKLVTPQEVLVAALPEAAVEVSPRWLIRGQVRVRSVEILRPHVQLIRDESGALSLGVQAAAPAESEPVPVAPEGASQPTLLSAIVLGLTGDKEQIGPLVELKQVRLVQANAEITDRSLGTTWTIPDASLNLQRSGQGAVSLSASLEVNLPTIHTEAEPDRTHLDLRGSYTPAQGALTMDVSFGGIQPSVFAGMAPGLEALAGLAVPLGGTVSLGMEVDGQDVRLNSAAVTASAGEGELSLPDELGASYQIAGLDLTATAQAHKGQSLLAAANNDHVLEKAVLERLDIRLKPLQDGDGPSLVSVSGWAENTLNNDGYQALISAETQNVPVAALATWWPRAVAPNPREWVTTHLRDGKAQTGRWDVSFKGATLPTLEPVELKGLLHAEGMTVDYLPPMPAVRNGVADVSFSLQDLEVVVSSGEVPQDKREPLILQKGTVLMSGLNLDQQMTDIALEITGDLPAALTLIDSQPLGYASKLGLKPSQAKGQAVTSLKMRFPPLADLKLDQIEVKAEARLSAVSLAGAVFGQDLSDGNLTLDVDAKALNAKGTAGIGGIQAAFTWREVFSGRPYRSRYRVHAVVEEDKRGIFGLTFPPFTPKYIAGPATADIDLTIVNSAQTTLNAEVDLKNAALHIPGFDWHKPVGTPAQATVAVRLAGGSVREVPSFKVRSGNDLALEGRVELDSESALQKLILSHAQVEASDFKATLTRQADDGYLVDLDGTGFDLVPYLKRKKAEPGAPLKGNEPATTPPVATDAESLPPLTINARFDTVWLAEDGTLDRVEARARRVDGQWRWAEVRGKVEGADPFSYSLTPRTDSGPMPAERRFSAETSNAGGLLRALGMLGTMQNGSLLAKGTVTPEGVSTGTLEIENYRLVEAPLLARVLSVAALTGILDSLRGEGIGFDHLTAPFTLSDDLLLLRGFQTNGAALGLTGSGRVNLKKDEIDVGGTIVPAYAVNSLLGKIPLVGGLLSGFTDGGGLIAATYSVKGQVEEPDISVNPLSALAPGLLKRLFGMGEPDQPVSE